MQGAITDPPTIKRQATPTKELRLGSVCPNSNQIVHIPTTIQKHIALKIAMESIQKTKSITIRLAFISLSLLAAVASELDVVEIMLLEHDAGFLPMSSVLAHP
jgi:hypothetical protein